jgi:two-component system, chemotaxis family, CheB/CheR fusion protein
MTDAIDRADSARADGGRALSLVVGVGASAGGLEAFKQLLRALPHDSAMAFILVQHLDRHHDSLLAELLARCTALRVVDARDGALIEPNTVYVIRPGTVLGVGKGRLEVGVLEERRALRLPVDHLFQSLARELGPRAAGIVLSGAGRDGTVGLRAIKAAGGLAVAQQPDTAPQPGMPQSAIEAGVVDATLLIAEMPEVLERYASLSLATSRAHDPDRGGKAEELSAEVSARLAAILKIHNDFDVSHYKAGTVTRRFMRRMGLAGHAHIERYLEHLRESNAERRALVRDLLIGVTEFFRNPEAYETLATTAIAELAGGARPTPTIRAWIPGCATGEEAYSLAMLLLEAIDAHDESLSLQVFATDVDETALEVARAGIYPPAIRKQVSPKRLEQFFTVVDGRGFQVQPRLRDVISFAIHDLLSDPPFSRMDLISCRNVLIYFRPEAQAHVLNALHFALEPEGYLFLGSSESIAAQPDLFRTVSKPWRIYQRMGSAPPVALARPAVPALGRVVREGSGRFEAARREPAGVSITEAAHQALLSSRVPPSVVVAGDGRILYAHGDLHEYLRYPRGEPRLEIMSALSDDLAIRVRAALYQCRRDSSTVIALVSPVTSDKPATKITASPVPHVGEGAVVITFEPVARSDSPREGASLANESGVQGSLIEQLERELHATREDLRTTVEELDTTNEELRASNEESMSMNEELQAANEELEATSEELRSLNAELATVNAHLRDKVAQLEQAHDDLSNFFASTKLATLFLDEGLRIKSFTPAAADLLELSEDDRGRHLGNLTRELLKSDLAEDASSVLATLVPLTREVEAETGRWFFRRLLPYRTGTQRIEGVVVTWTDVTELKQTSARLAVRERQQATIAWLGMRALEADDIESFMEQLVREVRRALDTDFCKILELQPGGHILVLKAGSGWSEGLVGRATEGSDLDSPAGYTLSVGEAVVVENLATEKRFSAPALLRDHEVVSGMSCAVLDGDAPYGVLGAYTAAPRVFTEDDVNFLQAAANVLAGAINRKRYRQRLAVDRGVARALSESLGLDDAVPRIFEVFAQELGIGICELWTPVPGGDTLRCTSFSIPEEPYRRDALARFLDDRTLARGEGLVGRAWERSRAEWTTSLDDPREFARGDLARDFGLVCGFAFPILAGHEFLGVMSLLSRHRVIADRHFLGGLEAIGAGIGEFVRQTEAANTTRANEERFRLAVEAAGALVYETTFPDSIIVYLLGAERLLGETTQTPVPASWWFDRIHPDDLSRPMEQTERTTRGEQDAWTLEYRMRHRDGHYLFVEGHGRIVRGKDGSPRRIGVVLDASERKRSAAILADRERRLRLAIGALEAGVFEHAVPVGQDLYLSERWVEILGYQSEEMPPSERFQDWLHHDVVHQDDQARFKRAYSDFIEGNAARLDIDVRMRHKRGRWIWCRSVADAAERDQTGRVTRLTGLLWDITQTKEAERRLQRTFETSQMGMAFAHADCRITRCNDAALAMLGYSRDDFEAGSFDLRALSPPEFAEQDQASFHELLRTGRLEPAEKEVVRKDGSRITVLISAATLGFADEFVAFLVDLTRQKRTETELSKLASIVESSDDAILSKDMQGIILSWNRGAERLYGYTAEETVGKPVTIIIPPELVDERDTIMGRLARGEHIDSHETVRRRKDGSRVDVSITISPVMDKWGRIIGASAVARDITERKRAEEALREADRQKDQFLAMLGHELRNPLAAIRNASELLKLIKSTDSNLERTASVLDRQTTHMAKLIDGLLDISRMVRGKIVLDKEVVDLVQILGHVLQDHAGRIESRGLELRADIPAAPIWVAGDRVRLAQIFDNLLSNAIKFTQRSGSIVLTVRGQQDMAVIRMRDSGMGIDPELLPHIFEPFRQAVQTLDRSAGGLGLGLALVKGVVQLHGGEVEARSEGLDRGAEFIVRLPLTTPQHEQPAQQVAVARALRLLVVDDHEDAADLLRELLAASSHEVAVAYSAPRALAIARDFKPEVILCDIGLPDGISGYDLARAIRDDATLHDVFLVAVTGYGRPDDRRQAEEAGFDAHLTKPVRLETLQEILARARK